MKGSIKRRIIINVWVAVLPMFLLTSIDLVNVYHFYHSYDNIVQNITKANTYNMAFKDQMDESMYRIVIGAVDWKDAKEREEMGDQNPYTLISKAKTHFKKLQSGASGEAAYDLSSILSLLTTLNDRVDDIIANVEEGGHYDTNIYMFNMDISILTTLIQNTIQDYIYQEASAMELVRQELEGEILRFIHWMIAILMIVLVFNIFLTQYISKKVTEPIYGMCKIVEGYAAGELDSKIPVNNKNELDILAKSFNNMGDEIKELLERNAREQKQKRALSLQLLQAQINPHFLYNTLDTIIWLIGSNENQQAIDMLAALSDFFRTSLSKGKDIITVGEEVKHIKSYLQIQGVRYRDILDYSIQIPESIQDYTIMKMTLQPIVENALYHGIKNKRGGGKIEIFGEEQEKDLILTVADTGAGMTVDQQDQLRQRILTGEVARDEVSHGFGVANVIKRLRLYYGQRADVTVKSELGEGTVIRIRIPKEHLSDSEDMDLISDMKIKAMPVGLS